MNEMTGPGWSERWTSWKSRTTEQSVILAISHELEKLLGHEKARNAQLAADEITTIKRNLQAQKIAASDELVSICKGNRLFYDLLLKNSRDTLFSGST